jgi:hypothetical protein
VPMSATAALAAWPGDVDAEQTDADRQDARYVS